MFGIFTVKFFQVSLDHMTKNNWAEPCLNKSFFQVKCIDSHYFVKKRNKGKNHSSQTNCWLSNWPFFLSFHHACDLTKSFSRVRNVYHSMFMWDFSLWILWQAVSAAACITILNGRVVLCETAQPPKTFFFPSFCLTILIVHQKIWSCISRKPRRE